MVVARNERVRELVASVSKAFKFYKAPLLFIGRFRKVSGKIVLACGL